MHFTKWVQGTMLLLIILLSIPSEAVESDVELHTAEFLNALNIEELMEVEVTLDEVFNVFDGLVKAKRTKIATGTEQSTDLAPAVTTVITSQDIEAMGARNLEEILRSVPGLQVAYSVFNIPIYTVRGISSAPSADPELLVLINGIRVNDSFRGAKGLYWSGFPVSAISQIEVIRGPGSAVYGADAFAGVLNIVTKSASEIGGTEVGLRVGKFNTQDAWILHGQQWQGWEIAATAEVSRTKGHQENVEIDAQTALDKVYKTQASLAPGPYSAENTLYDVRIDLAKQPWQLRAGIHRGEDMGVGAGVSQALDPTKPLAEERINADLTYYQPQFSDNWELQAQLSYLRTTFAAEFMTFPPGAFGGAFPIGHFGSPTGSEHQTQLSLSGFYRGFTDHLIRMGIGYSNYDLYETRQIRNFGLNPFTGLPIPPTQMIDTSDSPGVFAPEVARNNKYLFLQDAWVFNDNWELTSGIRYDDYSDFGSTINPRLGIVWKTFEKITTKLLYGSAFRAPSFQELYNQNNPVVLGNPNLKPENMASWEVAFDYRATSDLHLSLNLYHYDITDKIILVPMSKGERGYANASNWKGQGLEGELRWKTSSKSSLLLNYSYQDSRDDKTNVTLTNAPKQTAFLRSDYLLGSSWYINTQLNWVDDWPRITTDPRPDMASSITLDLTLRQKDIRKGNTNFALGIRNLFDAEFSYPSPGPGGNGVINIPNDLPGAGRSFFGEFRYRF